MAALLVAEEGVVGQVVQGEARPACQGVLRAEEHVRLRPEERLERKVAGTNLTFEHLAVACAQVENAQLTAHARHVVYDLVRFLFSDSEIVTIRVELPDDVDEGVHCERVVLARHAEVRRGVGRALVAALEQVGLLEHLAGVAQEGLALLGERHALARAVEDLHAHLALQVAHGCRDAGLRHEEPARRLGDVAALRHLHRPRELLQLHPSDPFLRAPARPPSCPRAVSSSRKPCLAPCSPSAVAPARRPEASGVLSRARVSVSMPARRPRALWAPSRTPACSSRHGTPAVARIRGAIVGGL